MPRARPKKKQTVEVAKKKKRKKKKKGKSRKNGTDNSTVGCKLSLHVFYIIEPTNSPPSHFIGEETDIWVLPLKCK